MKIALINNKGGVGKTTTAVNLAAAYASEEHRVLLLDLDSQGAAGLSLGVPRQQFRPSMVDVMMDGKPLSAVIRKTEVPGLDLVTGGSELADFDVTLAVIEHREQRLKRALAEIEADYTHIIIDCPPSFSLLSINALLAAEHYIVPVVPNVLTISGLASLIEEINRLCDRIPDDVADFMGVVLTMVDYRNGTCSRTVEAMRSQWHDLVFKSEIRINVKLAEAPAEGRNIFDYAPKSTGAACYKQLAAEVLKRWKREEAQMQAETEAEPQQEPPPAAEAPPETAEGAPEVPAPQAVEATPASEQPQA
ncbi:MAG TPA: ParA family protein [Planctomycetota bacterium]|jgi:chromosome partitioning protein